MYVCWVGSTISLQTSKRACRILIAYDQRSIVDMQIVDKNLFSSSTFGPRVKDGRKNIMLSLTAPVCCFRHFENLQTNVLILMVYFMTHITTTILACWKIFCGSQKSSRFHFLSIRTNEFIRIKMFSIIQAVAYPGDIKIKIWSICELIDCSVKLFISFIIISTN